MAFLINSSLLSFAFATLCFTAALFEYIVYQFALSGQSSPIYFIAINLSSDIYRQRALLYIVFSSLSLIVAWLFYRFSLPFAEQYGHMFRSAFDLYRIELLRHLNQPLPKNNLREYDQWRKISEFFMHGDRKGPLYFPYRYNNDEDGSTKKVSENKALNKD